jgi:chemosensory pili system protein ChpB (putative protein-glutamate methylesterase)
MTESRRVALLARPGEARERLRAALREAGGDIVLEADPSTLEPQQLRVLGVETILVALDPAVEDALEKFDEVLSDRAVEVIFDEADLAARREGWDAARWVRHLSAKLHRHDDVLPPGREPDSVVIAAPIAVTAVAEADLDEEDVAVIDLDIESIDAESMDAISMDSISMDALSMEDEANALDLGSLDMDSIEVASLGEGISLDLPAFETHATSVEVEAAPAFGGIAFTDDINDLDFEASDAVHADVVLAEVSSTTYAAEAQDFDALMRDLGAGDERADEAPVALPPMREFASADELPNMRFDISSVEPPAPKTAERAMPSFASLSLEDLNDVPATSAATQKTSDSPVTPNFRHDLNALERKIGTLALVDDNAARGAVVILAGIGGPDAVRQILTALPPGFPRAVLISQRLDGGRYDRLVQQMARAAALPVALAETAAMIQPGHVYIVPPDIGVDATGGLRFAGGKTLLDALAPEDTAVLLLSGADPALVDPALAHSARGALVAGQSPDGCYDAAAPIALTERGGTAASPFELVQSLIQRWPA